VGGRRQNFRGRCSGIWVFLIASYTESKLWRSCFPLSYPMTKHFVVSVGVFILASLIFIVATQPVTTPQPKTVVTPVSPSASSSSQTSTMPIEAATTTPAPTPVRVLTSSNSLNWKTYRNEKYGYEFEYPANWMLEEQYDGVNVRAADDAYSVSVNAEPTDPERQMELAKDCQRIKFSGTDAYYCNQVSTELGGAPTIIVSSSRYKKVWLEIQDSNLDSVSRKIISTFTLL
jgi:hypothetical protein